MEQQGESSFVGVVGREGEDRGEACRGDGSAAPGVHGREAGLCAHNLVENMRVLGGEQGERRARDFAPDGLGCLDATDYEVSCVSVPVSVSLSVSVSVCFYLSVCLSVCLYSVSSSTLVSLLPVLCRNLCSFRVQALGIQL